eukprot:scaffold18644_cov116-Skeletonema_marinoi.AAC.1
MSTWIALGGSLACRLLFIDASIAFSARAYARKSIGLPSPSGQKFNFKGATLVTVIIDLLHYEGKSSYVWRARPPARTLHTAVVILNSPVGNTNSYGA